MNKSAKEKDSALIMSPPIENPVIKVVATVRRNKMIWIFVSFIEGSKKYLNTYKKKGALFREIITYSISISAGSID